MERASIAPSDRRVRRTREAIKRAYSSLFLEFGFDAIGVNEIAERADVSRSTFYKHYAGKEEILCETMRPMLEPIAEAAFPCSDLPKLAFVIDHLWANKQLARALFAGAAKAAVTRVIADYIEKRHINGDGGLIPIRLAAMATANAQLGLLEEWLSGRYLCSPPDLASALQKSSQAQLVALQP